MKKHANKCENLQKQLPTRSDVKSVAASAYPPQEGAKPLPREKDEEAHEVIV